MAEKIFIDASNTAMGRVASFCAKQALLGNEISILNCEKAVISGNAESNILKWKERRQLNSQKPRKGPNYSKNSERMMKRAIRGMLPDFRLGRGKEAFRRIKCYIGLPEQFSKEKLIKIEAKVPKKKISLEALKQRM